MLRDNCSADLFYFFDEEAKKNAWAGAKAVFFLPPLQKKINQPSNGGGPGPWGPIYISATVPQARHGVIVFSSEASTTISIPNDQ